MKIKIRDITSKGLEIQENIDPKDIGLDDDNMKCQAPLDAYASVERTGDEIIVAKVKVKGVFSFLCARCLESVEKMKEHSFFFDYEVEKGQEFIDITEDIRQEIILGVSSKILCEEDCKGICTNCGVNLNNEECKCDNSG